MQDAGEKDKELPKNSKPDFCTELQNENKCEGLESIKDIRDLIAKLTKISTVNKTNLENLSTSYRGLAESNDKLFARTEDLRVDAAKLETIVDGHINHDNKSEHTKKDKTLFLVSMAALGLSAVAIIIRIFN